MPDAAQAKKLLYVFLLAFIVTFGTHAAESSWLAFEQFVSRCWGG